MVAGGEGTGHGDRLQHERQDRSRCQRRQPSSCEVRGSCGWTDRPNSLAATWLAKIGPGIHRGPGGPASTPSGKAAQRLSRRECGCSDRQVGGGQRLKRT
jgi:hypothetical protein